MEANWNIVFTQQFERDVKRFKKSGNDNWLGSLAFLRSGPEPNTKKFKALKNYSKAFRWRKGNLRVIFRVIAKTRSILLLVADHRKSVYRRPLGSNQDAIGNFDDLLDQENLSRVAGTTVTQKEPSQETFSFDLLDDESTLEQMFIDESDLYLIGISERYYSAILDVQSMEELRVLKIPDDVRLRVEDYLTAPAAHHVGRIYQLDSTKSLQSISEQSLDKFLVALDPQQRNIVDRSFKGGPWLIRGGPGTGKTLINLARIRRIYDEEVGKDLLKRGPIRVGFITYNTALSRSAESMFQAITQRDKDDCIEFCTFDALVKKLVGKIGGNPGSIMSERDAISVVELIFSSFKSDKYESSYIKQVRDRRGNSFFIEEFNETILGCGLHNEEEYLRYPRKGRRVRLQAKERGLIHTIYRLWLKQLKAQNRTTFAARRLALLRRIESGQINIQSEKFDFIFVDELQDLSVTAIRVLANIVKHTENLTFTADTAQSIYLKSPSWSNISNKIRFHAGNSFILRNSYRMTRQIERAVRPLRINSGDAEKENDGIDKAMFNGAKPVWLNCSLNDHPLIAATLAKTIAIDNHINLGQIAVITPDKKMTAMVSAEFRKLDLSVDIVEVKKMIDIHAQAAHLLHVHIAKGLEFPFVIVVGVVEEKYPNKYALQAAKDEDEKQEELDKSQRMLYVALSRAARGLYILSDPAIPSQLLSVLNPDDWDIQPNTKRSS